MKIAIILPDPKVAKTLRLSFHFLLASRITNDIFRWYAYVASLGDFIIVDNGAPEGELVSKGTLISAANAVRASEVILPDVLRDMEQTIELSTNKSLLNDVKPSRRFVVPQGSNWEEWEECARVLIRECRPATVGVPKWTQELPGGRVHGVKFLLRLKKPFNIHLLGMARPPREEFAELKIDGVRSIDTALPIALSQHDLILGAGTQRVSMDWDAPYNGRLAERNVQDLLHIEQEAKCIYM
jgi:hypothetical protein